jgi:hypothetical protein
MQEGARRCARVARLASLLLATLSFVCHDFRTSRGPV